jgi:hypothetical protein
LANPNIDRIGRPIDDLPPLLCVKGMSMEEPIQNIGQTQSRLSPRRGFLDPKKIKTFAFWTITLCILISVLASILAIWNFADTDTLWRTVATCVVVAGGTAAFAVVNSAFGR